MDFSAQSDLSKRYHSLVFSSGSSDKNTWDDWHLIPSEAPVVNPPDVQTKFIEIPGMNGKLDISDIRGGTRYQDRTGSWKFYIIREYPGYDRVALYNEIRNFLHGKVLRVYLLDDPYYYYEGRFSIESFTYGSNYSDVTIGYTLKPKATNTNAVNSADGWLWDPFNFEMDTIDTSVEPHVVVVKSPIL